MTTLILWIGLCMVAAFVLRRRPLLLVVAVLAIMFLVPTVGSSEFTGQSGGSLSFHAGTWLIAATFAVQLTHAPGALRAALIRHFYLVLVLLLVIAAGVLATRVGGGGGLVVLVDQVVAPAVFFFLIVSLADGERPVVRTVVGTLVALAAVESVIALVQWSNGDVLFYRAGFESQYWFTPKLDRWMGTLDQPLTLSLALCVAGGLLASIRHAAISLPLLLLLAAGVLTSQSRVGILTFCAIIVFVVLSARLRAPAKAVALAVVAVAGALIAASPLVAGVLGRFADDTGSSQARELATDFFARSWSEFLIAGEGMTASYRVGQAAGLGTSLENPFLMYSIDLGMLFTVLYFGSMVVIVVRAVAARVNPGLLLAGVLVLALPQTYSSLATRSVAGVLVWTVLALLVLATQESQRARRERLPLSPQAPGPRRVDRVPWTP